MRVHAGAEGRGRIENLPPLPDLGKYSDDVLDVVQITVGTDPQPVLDLYLAAQKQAGKIREELAEIGSRLASHKARYWGNGTNPSFFDIDRKNLLARISERIRNDRLGRGEKVTEAALESAAHADRDYLDFIDRERVGRLEMELLQVRHSGVRDRLETAMGVVSYYDKAIRLTEELIRFARGELRNG
jgi:hypothetical protein